MVDVKSPYHENKKDAGAKEKNFLKLNRKIF
jgi:hypothetical protein